MVSVSNQGVNFLAHLCLADLHGICLPGSLLGDFAKGPIETLPTEELRLAVRLHRRIDSFTDQHELVRRSKQRLDPGLRHFRGVLVDLFFDHYLSLHWDCFHDRPLEEFCAAVYEQIGARRRELPSRMQRLIDSMIGHHLLGSYARIAGIRRALEGMSRRFPRPNPLGRGAEELERHYRELEGDFLEFFPLLVGFVERSVPTLRERS